MKKFILLGFLLMGGMLFSCSNDDNEDLSTYQQDIEVFNTGGEDDDLPPPPPIPTPVLP